MIYRIQTSLRREIQTLTHSLPKYENLSLEAVCKYFHCQTKAQFPWLIWVMVWLLISESLAMGMRYRFNHVSGGKTAGLLGDFLKTNTYNLGLWCKRITQNYCLGMWIWRRNLSCFLMKIYFSFTIIAIPWSLWPQLIYTERRSN